MGPLAHKGQRVTQDLWEKMERRVIEVSRGTQAPLERLAYLGNEEWMVNRAKMGLQVYQVEWVTGDCLDLWGHLDSLAH